MSKNSELKSKFRRSVEWKNFRNRMADLYDNKDAITGKPLRKGWNLHHLDMSVENYQDLDESKFIPLNKSTHEMLHQVFRYSYAIDKLTYYVDKMNQLNKQESKKNDKIRKSVD